MILEVDAVAIANRVLLKEKGTATEEMPMAELTFAQAFSSAREQFLKLTRA